MAEEKEGPWQSPGIVKHVTGCTRCERIRWTEPQSAHEWRRLPRCGMTQSAEPSVVSAHMTVHGRVQGVGFRVFAAQAARRLQLLGGVWNRDDGRVVVEVEGPKVVIETLLKELTIGPPAAEVSQIETRWGPPTGRFSDFRIWYEHRSS